MVEQGELHVESDPREHSHRTTNDERRTTNDERRGVVRNSQIN